jgi:twitching motility protein PilT
MAQIDGLFERLLQAKGSDLHLAVGHPPMARVRGELVPLGQDRLSDDEMRVLLFEITNDQQRNKI